MDIYRILMYIKIIIDSKKYILTQVDNIMLFSLFFIIIPNLFDVTIIKKMFMLIKNQICPAIIIKLSNVSTECLGTK